MKKILIPTDFSDNAWDALTYAMRLYDDIPCCFYILNTYNTNSSRLTSMQRNTKLHTILKEDSEKELEKINSYLNEYLQNDKHEYITKSVSGDLIPAMKRIIASENISAVIMGTTGASGAKEIFMGSNAVNAIKRIELCPVITVPKKYEYQDLEKVIIATDFERGYSLAEMTPLVELQLLYNFDIFAVHVKKTDQLSTIQQQNIKTLKSIFQNLTIEIIENETSVSSSINKYALKNEIDMVCLVNYEHSFIEKLTHEPIVKKINFHSSVPIITLSV
tara:strand:+ start:82479 stop:83306 length:828 start_codon:yes stop_codon:yes gene_type:complete